MNIEEILKKETSQYISKKIDEEIEKKVNDFRYELTNRKDDYISEIMKAIRIHEERVPRSMQNQYIITFENRVMLGSEK